MSKEKKQNMNDATKEEKLNKLNNENLKGASGGNTSIPISTGKITTLNVRDITPP